MIKDQEEKKEDEAEWIYSYADLMSLLMCFFVILYATAVVDKDKHETMIDNLRLFFSNKDIKDVRPYGIEEEQNLYLLLSYMNKQSTISQGDISIEINNEQQKKIKEENIPTNQVESIRQQLSGLKRKIENEKSLTYKIILPNSLIFRKGTTHLSTAAEKKLLTLAKIIQSQPDLKQIEIIGHADSTPIRKNRVISNNRALSALRASNISEILSKNGIDPAKITVIAKGESDTLVPEVGLEKTLKSNNQDKNRRIEIILKYGKR